MVEQGSGSEELSAQLIFGGGQETEETEQRFPKVSVKTTGAAVPLNKGSERQTYLEKCPAPLPLKPTCINLDLCKLPGQKKKSCPQATHAQCLL